MMDVLPLSFRFLSHCGLWHEDNFSFFVLRRCWGYLLVIIIFYFTTTEVIELWHLRSDVEELVDVMFLTVTYLMLCFKIWNFSFRRKDIQKLLGCFRKKICQPQSPDEEVVLRKYFMKYSKISTNIMVLSQATGIFFSVLPFVNLQSEDYELPFKTYQFYDDTIAIGFTITCVIQFMALIFGIFMNVSLDTMIYGFIILTTGQFKLINHRIYKSTKENDKALIRECVIHYIYMKKTAYLIQHVFISVIAPLFFFSLLTLCASIFQMSKNDLISLEFLGFTMYLSCMLCQVFLYCWYGNELKIKSEDIANDIYRSEWTSLDLPEKKTLCLLMLTAQKGSTISWKGQCTLSLDTFAWIMKTSYTAFNLLQRVSVE